MFSSCQYCLLVSLINIFLQLLLHKSDAAPVPDLAQTVDTNSAVKYLAQFGYLPTPDPRKALLLTEDGVSKALKRLQKFGGINETGVLDDDTIELIKTPRCGMKDDLEEEQFQNQEIREVGDDENEIVEKEERGPYFPIKKRKKRFALQGSRWKTRFLTYKVGKYPTGLTNREVDSDVSKAFSMWASASGLTFMKSNARNVHIEIRFENYNHGDEDAFDGPGGVVAHAFFPEFGGDAHFDNGEHWTVNRYTGTSLLQSLTHEFGHSLGLLHSSNKKAMMGPYHRGWNPNLKLHSDDIKAIQKLYGKNKRNSNFRRKVGRIFS